MKTALLVALLGLLLVPLRAEDWTTLDGKTYKNVQVLSHNAAYVTILHENGGGRLPLSTLKPDLQARFGYDPAKAQPVIAATKAADQRDQEALAQEKVRIRAQLDQEQEEAARGLASALFSPPSNAVLMASDRPSPDAFSNQSLNSPTGYGSYDLSDYNGGYSSYYGYDSGDYGYGGYPYYGYGGYFNGYPSFFRFGGGFSNHFGGHGHGGSGHHH